MALILKESLVEDLISKTLDNLGYIEYIDHFNKNNLTNVLDYEKLKEKLILINKNLQIEYIEKAIEKIKKFASSTFQEGNLTTLKWLQQGIDIKIEKISSRTMQVFIVDFNDIDNNDFNYIRQMNISCSGSIKIPDIVIYLNGIPVSIIELKSPEAKENLNDAYDQVVNYARSQSSFMYWNIFSCVSNGFFTRYGSVTSSYNHWWAWKKKDINDEITQDVDYEKDQENAINNYKKNIIGIFSKETLLNILKNYIFYAQAKNKYTKYIPTYYQYYATEKAILSIEKAKHGRAGVVWHTQGSGKSVTMLFLTHRIKSYFSNENFKIVLVTDRTELDEQLHKRFCEAQATYLFSEPKKISSRKELKNILSDDDDFGIYITTIQKFTESNEPLSNKNNIIVIADEAHRSHNNIEIEYIVDKESKKIIEKEGYAKYIRDAFPNAKFVGFTGTPLKGDKKTTDIFGDYIDQYTMSQAVYDGSTVPIHYEKRRVEIVIDKVKSLELDEIYNEEEKENENEAEYIKNARYEHIKKKLINISNLLSDDDVIETVVNDFWNHYQERQRALNGKAMFVAFNRNIAYLIYNEMIKQKPTWKDKIKLVITGSNKDNEDLAKLIPSEDEKRKLAIEFKKDDSSIKIVIVVDMWLTGFDVPDLDTLYLFKVIKWHNLMQTIARVNRTYNGQKIKQDGLVVDYIGIWKYISDALKQYAGDNKQNFDIDEVKISLLDACLKIKKKFFDSNNILKYWVEKEIDEKYSSIINGYNVVTSLNKQEQNLYFALVSKISRWYKLCSQVLNEKQKLEAQFYIIVRNLIRTSNVEEAIDVQETIKKLKNKMNDIIKTGDIEVSQVLMDGKKDLSYVYQLLEQELKSIKENNEVDNLKSKSLENEMKNQIKIFARTNPLKAQKLSNDLKQLVSKYEQDKNIEEFINGLIKFGQIMKESNEINSIMGEDENLQKFYSVIADERFKMRHQNSEILREITLEIMKVIKDEITPQWWTNKRLRDTINLKIKVLLKNKYNYPPEDAKDVSKILIDEIDNVIRINPKYFTEEHER